jgi:hypothetical protein
MRTFRLLSRGVGIALMGVAGTASAQESLAGRGGFMISAERIFGLVWTHQSLEQNGATRSDDSTNVSLLSSRFSSTLTGYSAPRIGFDYFATEAITIGGAIGYVHSSTSSKTELRGTSTSADGPSLDGFIFAPRVGYAAMFNETIGIWPRVGVTYVHASASTDDSNLDITANAFALTLEAPIVFAVVPHGGFWLGPTFDLGLSGSQKTKINVAGANANTETDGKVRDLGAQAGLFIYF